jgi:hypothetical protein
MKTVFTHSFDSLGRLAFRGVLRLFTPIFLVALTLFTAVPGMASAQTLGHIMCNAAYNITPFVWLFTGVAYIAGGYFIGHGLWLLSRHHENPRETQLHNPIMHLVGGTCLLAFPSFVNFMITSLGLVGPGGGGMPVCAGAVAVGGFLGGGVGLDVLLENLVYNIRDPLTVLASIAAIVIGVLMIFRGLVRASKYGYDPRGTKVSHVLANLIIGSILVVVGQSLGTMLTTLFGSSFINSSSDVLAWNVFTLMPGGETGQFQYAVMAALTFVQLMPSKGPGRPIWRRALLM